MARQERRRYSGSIPAIAEAFKNDPRTLLANAMMAQGTSSSPVAQGGWGVTDGLARAAQAIAGGFSTRQNERRYETREQEYIKGMQQAAALAGPPADTTKMAPPVAPPPVTQQAAAALAQPQAPLPMMTSGQGVPQPIQSFDPGPSTAAQAQPPQMADAAQALAPPQAPPPPAQAANFNPQVPPRVPMSAARPTTGGTGPNRGATDQPWYGTPQPRQAQPDTRDMFMRGIVAIESDPNDPWDVSGDGAIGPAQVMPGTAREAARLAGLPYDERRYRSDAQYNLELGHAYFAEQLRTFGDPLKAAAAYNAGPGNVRSAMRRARQNGGTWMDYLPVDENDNTRNYVNSFSQRIGQSITQGSRGGSDVTAVGATQIAPPTMEEVPQAPAAPTAADRPQPFELPAEVQSSRIAIAQRMLQSGNPDMVQIAQSYLDQGLTEQNAARTLRSEQQFDRDNTGYQYGLQDYNDATSSARQFGYDSNRDAQQRNYGRETGYRDQTFQAGESAADREQQARLANQQQSWEERVLESEQTWKAEQAALQREADAANSSGDRRNPLLETQGGLRIRQEQGAERATNQGVIASLDRFLELQERQQTGGWILGSETTRSIAGMLDPEVREMQALANKIVIGDLGGLGVAISDGDRKFVADSIVSPGAPRITNINRGNIIKSILHRRNDYTFQWEQHVGRGQDLEFEADWQKYINEVPIVNQGENGTLAYNPMTFEQWRNAPQYDANGRRVN